MAAFFGLDLFDPSASDEPATSTDDSDLLLSASELEQRERKIPPRSKTAVDLRAEASKYPIGTVRIRCVEIALPKQRMERDDNMFIMIPFPRTRMASAHSEGDFSSLPPEPQQGNIEYKLKLINPTEQRLQHLVTQMKWRLREGQGTSTSPCRKESSSSERSFLKREIALTF